MPANRTFQAFLIALLFGLSLLSCQNGNPEKTSQPCKSKPLNAVDFVVCEVMVDTTSVQNKILRQFILKIQSNKQTSTNPLILAGGNLQNLEDYYSFGFKSDIHISDKQSIVEPVIYNYSPNYGAAPFIEFKFGFDISELKDAEILELMINDLNFGGGLIKFPIEL